MFSLRSETDDGLSSCCNFPERPLSYELEIEHLRGKIRDGKFKSLKEVLNRNADVFQNIRRILVVAVSSSTKSD